MLIPGRHEASGSYRYGFNGKEKDDEIKGGGNSYDFGARMYDSRIGRWFRIDPLFQKYSALTPYNFSLNSPLLFKDFDGRDAIVTVQKNPNGGGKIIISSTNYIVGRGASIERAESLTHTSKLMFETKTVSDKEGNNWEVSFEIKFEYTENMDIELQKGENLIKLSDEKFRSHVPALSIRSTKAGVSTYTKTCGTIANVGFESNEYGEQDNTIFHELGHLLGLSDRYSDIIDEKGRESSKTHVFFEKDLMGNGLSRLSSLTHYENFVNYYSTYNEGQYTMKNKVDINQKTNNLLGTGYGEKQEVFRPAKSSYKFETLKPKEKL